MSSSPMEFVELLERDKRYKAEAYQFVGESLQYAQRELKIGRAGEQEPKTESHLTGQQLCEAMRVYALEQYGLMARAVLNSWGVQSTSDFGEIVYNLIEIKRMKKSPTDHREDFDDVYDFEDALHNDFRITMPD